MSSILINKLDKCTCYKS